MDYSEKHRKEIALDCGLSENATWKEINYFNSEKYRKNLALDCGLSENATWKEINDFNYINIKK